MLSLLLCILISISSIQGFVPAPGWEDEVACRYREHVTLGRATCCANTSYPVGLDLMDYWKDCATPAKVETEPLNATMWRIYTCIIEKALSGKPLSMESFAEIITKKYPDERKKQIMTRVKTSNVKLSKGAITTTANLKMIREAFYNAETLVNFMNIIESILNSSPEITCKFIIVQQDCYSPKNVTIPPTESCFPTLESVHRRGSCCLNNTIPISVLVPFVAEAEVLKQWKYLLESVSMNDPLLHGITIQKTCEITCDLLAIGKLTKEDVFKTPDAEKIIDILTPQFLTAKQKKDLKDTALALMKKSQKAATDPLVKAYTTLAEETYENTLKSELTDIKDEAKAKSLFVTCIIHANLSRYISTYFMKKCTSTS